MAGGENSFGLNNEVFSKFAFCSTLLLVKMVCVALWTIRHRVSKKVYMNPEDYKALTTCKPSLTEDPDIERIRRCHRNDLENLIPFVLIGSLYVLTQPDLGTAALLFRVFTGARFIHTIIYLNGLPTPIRFTAFLCGTCVTFYMAVHILSVTSF